MLDTDHFPPLLAKACHLISEHSFIYFVRDPRDESLVYGLVDDLPEPYRTQMQKNDSDFLKNMITMVSYMNKDNWPNPDTPRPEYHFSENIEEEISEFGKQFGWKHIARVPSGDESGGLDGRDSAGEDEDGSRFEELDPQAGMAGPSVFLV